MKRKTPAVVVEAGNRLLKATKIRLIANGEIDYSDLKRRGYSATIIERLKEA